MKTKQSNTEDGFLSMLLGKLGASLLRNLLASKGVIKGGDGVIWAAEGMIRAGVDF